MGQVIKQPTSSQLHTKRTTINMCSNRIKSVSTIATRRHNRCILNLNINNKHTTFYQRHKQCLWFSINSTLSYSNNSPGNNHSTPSLRAANI